jgi:hypothetical protein
MAHDPGNNSCPRNADPRNECCDCDRQPEKRIPTVEEIRQDPELGKGSCSTYEECYTDEELAEAIQKVAGYRDVTDVLAEMKRLNKAVLSVMMERMEGWKY